MLWWRGAVAAGLGCCVAAVAVTSAVTPLAFAAPVLSAAVLWVMTSVVRSSSDHDLSGRSGRLSRTAVAADESLLETRAAEAVRAGHDLTLMLVRFGGLDDVGDALGTAAREAVADRAVARVMGCLREVDTAVRLGSDQVAVLLPGSGPDQYPPLADQILNQLRRPNTTAEVSVVTPGSIGVASGSANLDELLRAANLALRQAAADGGDRVSLYGHELLHRARQRLDIEGELRAAVAGRQFRVYYQPIVDAGSGEVRSVEALVRWDHPSRGLIAPPEFLGAAERAGLMLQIGRQVLELSCERLGEWRRRWPDLAVAVNVSQAELLHPAFVGHVMATLGRYGLPTSALHLEVTETVAVDEDAITTALKPLADAGIACSLDDFGTGYSSLHRLQRIPVRRLKIDKSFVDEVATERGTAPLLASIISLAHSVGLCVVAEGVETPEQAAFLAERGCNELQGYLFSRPVPSHEVPSLLATSAHGIAATRAARR